MRFPNGNLSGFFAWVISMSHLQTYPHLLHREIPPLQDPTLSLGLTKRGLGRLSSSQMVVSKRPKSFPGAADVEERGALSKWVPGPRQKAQFMIDLFLLNDFWLKSGERERCLLREMHFNSSSSIWVLVVAMVSKEKMSWTQPTPCMQLSLIHHEHISMCV